MAVIPTPEDVQAEFVRAIGEITEYSPLSDGEFAKRYRAVANPIWQDMGQGVARLPIDVCTTLLRVILQVALDDHLHGQQQRIKSQMTSLAIVLANAIPQIGKVRFRFSEPQVRGDGPVKTVRCYVEGIVEVAGVGT